MAITTVRVVQLDPYHKQYGLLVPFVAQRLLEATQALGDEAGIVTPQFMARLWAKDQGVLLLAAVDPTGHVKGFTAAAQTHPNQVVILQPRLDEPTENDAIKEMIEAVELWAKGLGVESLTLVARRADPKWLRKYGFEVSQYVMTKELS